MTIKILQNFQRENAIKIHFRKANRCWRNTSWRYGNILKEKWNLRSRGFDPGTIRLPVEDLTNRAIERLDSSPLRFPYILDTFDGFFKCSKVNFNPHCTHFSHLHSLWSGQPQVVARSTLAGLEKKKTTACRLPRFNQSAGLTPRVSIRNNCDWQGV